MELERDKGVKTPPRVQVGRRVDGWRHMVPGSCSLAAACSRPET